MGEFSTRVREWESNSNWVWGLNLTLKLKKSMECNYLQDNLPLNPKILARAVKKYISNHSKALYHSL